MNSFYFTIDRKYTVWEKESYAVEAETLEDAKNKIIAEAKEPAYLALGETELLLDTMTPMKLLENSYYPTVEIFTDDGNLIYKNGKEN